MLHRLHAALEALILGFARSLGFGLSSSQSVDVEPEYEVYLPGRWDPATLHSRVLFTGSLFECSKHIYAVAHRTAPGSKPHIRATGGLLRVSSASSR